jgi:hypothetical protein
MDNKGYSTCIPDSRYDDGKRTNYFGNANNELQQKIKRRSTYLQDQAMSSTLSSSLTWLEPQPLQATIPETNQKENGFVVVVV